MKYHTSICAIAKDEEPALREWAIYHLLVGFEAIFIYDNNSRVPIRTVLADLVAEGLVHVLDWPVTDAPQLSAYAHHIASHGALSRWTAFIDVDEFVVPRRDKDIRNLLDRYADCAAVAFSWVVFGSNGHLRRPDDLCMRAYPNRIATSQQVKTIARCECLSGPISPHHFEYKPGLCCVNEDRVPVPGAWSYFSNECCQINHYYYKSEQDFCAKIERGVATKLASRDGYSLDEFMAQARLEGRPDEAIARFIEPVRKLYDKPARIVRQIAQDLCRKDVDQFLQEVVRSIGAGQLERAEERLRLLLRYYPDNCGAHVLAASFYRGFGDPERSHAHAVKAIGIEAKPESYYELLLTRKAMGKVDHCRPIALYIRDSLQRLRRLTPDWESRLQFFLGEREHE